MQVTDRRKVQHDKAIINCEFSMSTFATSERRKRAKGDRRNMETALIVKQTFESTVSTFPFYILLVMQVNLYFISFF